MKLKYVLPVLIGTCFWGTAMAETIEMVIGKNVYSIELAEHDAAKSFVRAGQSSACTVYLARIPVNTRFSGCNVRVETCGMIFRNTVGKLPDRQFPCVRLLYDTRRPAQISA